MYLKIGGFFLLWAVFIPLLSGCSHVSTDESEEVVIISDNPASHEVAITNADFKDENGKNQNSRKTKELEKRILPDGSKIEGFIDGFGNKTETRYFEGHLRLHFVKLLTSVDGKQQVTVYGYGGDTKMLFDVGENALTASGDEIADAAQLTKTRGFSESRSFIVKSKITSAPAPQSYQTSPVQTPRPASYPSPTPITVQPENSNEPVNDKEEK